MAQASVKLAPQILKPTIGHPLKHRAASAVEIVTAHLMLVFLVFGYLHRLFIDDECDESGNRIGLYFVLDPFLVKACCECIQLGIKLESVVSRDGLVFCRLLVNQNNDPLSFLSWVAIMPYILTS